MDSGIKTISLSLLFVSLLFIGMLPNAKGYSYNATTIPVSADATVLNNSYNATNYGSVNPIVCVNNTDSYPLANQAWLYLKFDLSSIKPYFISFSEITLKVYCSFILRFGGNNGSAYVSGVNSSWTEGGITWSNKPTPNSSRYDTQWIALYHYMYRWNVTASSNYIQHDNFIYSYAIRCLRDANISETYLKFESKESAFSSFVPTLEVTYLSTVSPESKPVGGFTLLNLPNWMGYCLGLNAFLGGIILSLIFNMAFLLPMVKFRLGGLTVIFITALGLNMLFYFIGWLTIWVFIILFISLIIFIGRRVFGW